MKSSLLSMVAAGLMLVGAGRAQAQELKPVVVVSLSGYTQIYSDIEYLGGLTGNPELAGALETFLQQKKILDSVEKDRPWGAAASSGGESAMEVVAFLPITDIKQFLESISEFAGEAEDIGDGVWQIEVQSIPVFLKSEGEWTFVGRSPESFANLPEDPLALLDGMHEKYDVAVRIQPRNIPEEMRNTDQLRSVVERGLQQQAEELTEEQQAEAERLAREQVEQINTMMNDLDSVTIGWAIDQKSKRGVFDMTMIGAEGSKFAKDQSKVQLRKSNFASFFKPDAVTAVNATIEIPEDQLAEMMKAIDQSQVKSEETIRESDASDEEKERRIEGSKLGVELVKLVVESGQIDMGMTMIGEGPFTVMGGGTVKDGARLQEIVEELLKKAEEDPEVSDVKLNASEHQGITFHTMMVSVPKDEKAKEMKELFGAKFPVVLGVGKTRGYFAIGEDGEEELKKLIGNAKSGTAAKAPPVRVAVALAPLLKLAATSNRNDLMMLTAASSLEDNGNDKLKFQMVPEKNGMTVRFEVEEGVLSAAVTVAQLQALRAMAGAGAGGGPGGGDAP